ncbi:structural protein [uncultured Caudovirales phage]|uniref:Structural protein n=1 Tax=uncultured Caudovirales phage TaxID=2100421 RepID=A0A6J5QGE8_9CAUD|nr:structural protein [uncultured Caudovirales phage]
MSKTSLQTCIDVVVKAAGDDISQDQAKSLVQQMMNEVENAKKQDFANVEEHIREIGRKIIEKDKLLSAIQQRNAFLTVKAERRIKNYVTKFGTTGEGLKAFMNGSNKLISEGRNSVYYQEVAVRNKAVGQLMDGLEKTGTMEEFKTGALDKQVFQEMWELNREAGQGKPGISGSPKAQAIAKVINDINLEMIGRENRAGAYIRPLEGYVIRQSHDADVIRRAGGVGNGPAAREASFKAWSEFILPLLDERTFEGVDDRMAFLRGSHEGIITGVHDHGHHAKVDVNSEFGGTGALARRVSAERVLHFKDAESSFLYNQTFGTKDLKESVLRSMQLRSKSISLMENFGPNPEMTFKRVVSDLRKEAAKSSDDQRALASLSDWTVEASFRELTGQNDRPNNPSLAKISASIRAITNMSKLGGSTITSLADKAFFQSEMSFQGMKTLETLTKQVTLVAEGRPDAERKQMLSLMGAAVDGFIGNVVQRFGIHDNKAGLLFKMQQKFFNLNGMNWWNDIHKGGAAELMSAHLANHAHLDSASLPKELSNTLKLYGIEGDMWDFVRQHGVKEVGGRDYLTPDALYSVDNLAIDKMLKARDIKPTENNRARMRDDIDTKLRTYFADRVDTAVPTPGNEEKVYAHWNTQAGTPLGEGVRMMMLFKSMPITVFKKVVSREIYGHGSNTMMQWLQNDRQGNFRMMQLIAMTAFGGYVSGAVKDAIRGRTPKDPSTPKTLLDALQRGGGLGIYGDFLFSEYDRSYRSFLATATGPVLGQLDVAADILSKLKQGENVSKETGKLALGNTPFINLFYIRPVLDYLFLWNLQEMSDPGSLRQMERRVEEKNNQGFFVTPSEVVNK